MPLKTRKPLKTSISTLEATFLKGVFPEMTVTLFNGPQSARDEIWCSQAVGSREGVSRGLQDETAPNQLLVVLQLQKHRCEEPLIRKSGRSRKTGSKKKLLFSIVLHHIRNWTVDWNERCQKSLWACIFSNRSDCAKRTAMFLWGVVF